MHGPILKGKKVTLQPPKLSEAKNYVAWLHDNEVTRYISSFTDVNVEGEKAFLKNMKSDPAKIFWSIHTKSGKHIGSTDLHNISEKHKRNSWGIMIGDKAEWSKGYGADVLQTIVKYVFTQLKHNRFELEVFHPNIAGIKCYKKCGFITEGVKKKYFIKNGEIYDSIMMALTDEDYKKMKVQKK